MTPYDRISEQYAIFLKWTRNAPNRLIVNPSYYYEMASELSIIGRDMSENYYGMKVVISKSVEEFELAFVYEVTDA